MMGHGAIGIAALLSTAAVGYFVCVKANTEKKSSSIRYVGLGLGAIIIILGLLGSLCIIAKMGNCPMAKKFMSDKNLMRCGLGHYGQPSGAPPVYEKGEKR